MVDYIRPERSYDSLGKNFISVLLYGVIIVIYCLSWWRHTEHQPDGRCVSSVCSGRMLDQIYPASWDREAYLSDRMAIAVGHMGQTLSYFVFSLQTKTQWSATLFVVAHLFLTLFSLFTLGFSFQRRSCHGHQPRHWGGLHKAGAPRAPQIERRQLFHQHPQFLSSYLLIGITDHHEWSLIASFITSWRSSRCFVCLRPCSNTRRRSQTSLFLWPIMNIFISPVYLKKIDIFELSG